MDAIMDRLSSKKPRWRRKPSRKSQFLEDCILQYGSKGPVPPLRNLLWCPILGTWVDESVSTATQLFPSVHGQDTMDALFGEKEESEIFSPRNGILMSTIVANKFDSGLFAIVPCLPSSPTPAEIATWNDSDPPNYKVCILDTSHPDIDAFVGHGPLKWADLDNKPLRFRSNFRPRAGYLYFHYCVQLLRRACSIDVQGAAKMHDAFGTGFWCASGAYLPASMLRTFVRQLGSGYQALMAGAAEDHNSTADPAYSKILAVTAVHQAKALPLLEGECEHCYEDSNEGSDEEGYEANYEARFGESDEDSPWEKL